MLRVGLTGGIATGKSYVTTVLRELGSEIRDADAIAHEVIKPGTPAYEEIVREFSPVVPDLLNPNGTINRRNLGAFVFRHSERLTQLNTIVHPRVFAAQDEWMREIAASRPDAIAIVDAALMIETGLYKRFDKIIVVHCTPEIQLSRLMERNQLSREEASARIASQMPASEKLRYADYSIDTSTDFEDTRQQTVKIWQQLQQDQQMTEKTLQN